MKQIRTATARHVYGVTVAASLACAGWLGGCSGDDAAPAVGPTSPEAGATPTLDAARVDGEPVDAAERPPSGSTATLALLEATDLHSNLRSYDYFKLVEDRSLGIERTASIIKEARAEFANSLLIDNGDTIQGTVLADYQALVNPVGCQQPIAVYKTMNALGFDVGGIGNHEFNYGLAFLSQVTHTPFDVDGVDAGATGSCAGPTFPQVLSNVFSTKTNKPIFPPSVIVEKRITAKAPGNTSITTTLKIGVFAFAPPAILSWDKRWLDGKVYTKGVQEVAPAIIADLRAKGADLIVAIIHGGLDNTPYTPAQENQAWHLAQIPGISALLMGHSHQIFPNAASTAPQFSLPLVDKDAGTVAGVPALMANFWGQHLGVIALGLEFDGAQWTVDKKKTVVEARPVATTCTGGLAAACDGAGHWRTGGTCAFASLCSGKADKTKVYVDADPGIAPLIETEHQATIGYVKTPIGTTDFEMSSFFAEVGDVGAIEIVNQAQADYVSSYVQQNLPQYATLPVLSVSAPFKSGFQGGNDYTDVGQGSVAINNAADLYLYANTLYAVKVNGAQLQDWLETAATRFAQVDPLKATDQPLINPASSGFNFDVVTDARISYEIDVTQPLPAMGAKASGRIKDLRFNGQPINPAQEFIVATNNYRASGGGNFPGLDGSKTILASPDSNRDVLIAYIKRLGNLTRAQNGSHRSFKFTPATLAGRVVFTSAQNALAKAQAAGLSNVTLVQQDDGSGKGLSVYAVGLVP